MTRFHTLSRRAINSWIAWRARRRLSRLKGWREAHDAIAEARARHGCSQPGLQAIRSIITASLARELGRPNPLERGMR